MRVAVIGLGLIGGSIALAARERLQAQTFGWDHDEQAVEAALARGAVTDRVGSLADAVAEADAAFVAAPVGVLPQLVGEVLAAAPASCVVSDVGSTKRAVVSAHQDPRFVGGHPLAGTENSGIAHARADLFDGAPWYLTPTRSTDDALYERLSSLIGALGAHAVAIDPDAHDQLIALMSQLPHVFANVLVAQAAAGAGFAPDGLPVAGPSFRGATRVAGADPAIWTDIYLSNRDVLVPALDDAIARLGHIREALAAADGQELTRWNKAAAEDRSRLIVAPAAATDTDVQEASDE